MKADELRKKSLEFLKTVIGNKIEVHEGEKGWYDLYGTRTGVDDFYLIKKPEYKESKD